MARIYRSVSMTILRPIVANLAILAATLSLITVVEFGPWFGWATAVTTGMLAVTTTSRWLLRKRGAQWISLPLALLTAAVFLVRLLTPSKMFAGFIPTMATLHDVGTLLSNASQTFQFSPPPVPANAGVTVVVLSSLVIVTSLVDLLALQAHAQAFAALPLLALWTPTIVLAREISLFLVFLSLVTWLALLALERAGRAAWYLSALRTSWALVSAAVVFALVSLLALPALQKWSHWSSFEVATDPRSTAPIVAVLRGFLATSNELQWLHFCKAGSARRLTSAKTTAADTSAQLVRSADKYQAARPARSRANSASQVTSDKKTKKREISRARTIVGVHNANRGSAAKAGAWACKANKSTSAVTMTRELSTTKVTPAFAGTGGGEN